MFLLYFQAIIFLYKGGLMIPQVKNQRNVDVKFVILLKISSGLLRSCRRLRRIADLPNDRFDLETFERRLYGPAHGFHLTDDTVGPDFPVIDFDGHIYPAAVFL